MEYHQFEELVTQALKDLPEEFKSKLENIDIVIEYEPNMDIVKSMKLGSKGRLLGLYQGVPLKSRTHYYGMVLPDKITIYMANIERVCNQEGKDLSEGVRHVIQHEIAHHFGISDQRLKDLGTY